MAKTTDDGQTFGKAFREELPTIRSGLIAVIAVIVLA